MKQDKKQTAVEWLVEQLLDGKLLMPSLIEQAKQMEEDQRMELADSAYEAGKLDKEFSNMFDNPKGRFMNSIKKN